MDISIDNFLPFLDEPLREVVALRVHGSSVKECARRLRLPEKTVRERWTSARDMIPHVREERYAKLFKTYYLPEDLFVRLTGDSREAWLYLSALYSPGKRSAEHLAVDPDVPAEVRRAAEMELASAGQSEWIEAGTERVHADRSSIIEYIGRELLEDDAVTLDFLRELYEDFLGDHGVRNTRGLAFTDSSVRASLRRSDKFLAPRDSSIRYYDMAGRDFTPLIDAIDPAAHDGLEYSAEFFWRAKPDVMAEYDLHNADELHALLRKITQTYNVEGLAVGHMPMISFGKFDRRAQVLSLMREMSPVTGADLSAEYEHRYGVLAQVVLVWLGDFALYRSNGLYAVSEVELTDEQQGFLREITQEECVDASYVRMQFRTRFPHSSLFALSEEALRAVGRFESGGLIFHQGVEPRAYFRKLIESYQVFNVRTAGFGEAVFNNPDFRAELDIRKRSGELLETAQDSYATSNRVQESTGVTALQLSGYADEVCAAVPQGAPFTIASLTRLFGFASPLDVLRDDYGVEDCLYENLLTADRRVRSGSLAGVAIFCIRSLPITGPAFLELVVRQLGAIDLIDLADVLLRDYGIDIDLAALRNAVGRSGLYYNSDIERAYPDRDAYRTEVEGWISSATE